MDVHGMFDRLLDHTSRANKALAGRDVGLARHILGLVVRPDGSYRPDGEARRSGRPDPPESPEPGLEASEISVTYPDGQHVFRRVGPDEWTLDLFIDGEQGPSVTGYEGASVLAVLDAFAIPREAR